MALSQKPLLTEAFLQSVWADEYSRFKDSTAEIALDTLLQNWARRRDLGETASEAPFINSFFQQLWDYAGTGSGGAFTYRQQFPIANTGQGGGTGRADLALGAFVGDDAQDVPQVLCEFKGVRGSLDAPQRRSGKAGDRTPVEQARDYLWGARRGLYGNEDVVPEWALVTNMREFRLYWFDRMPHEALIFTLGGDLFDRERSLFEAGDAGRFRRFVFSRVFHRDILINSGGGSSLRRLLEQQWVRQRKIERGFYDQYRALREALYNALVTHNSEFAGTRGRLLQLAQRVLDRVLFILYCEDRGGLIGFPPQLLRDFLRDASRDRFYDAAADDIWRRLIRLFQTMDAGGTFGPNQRVQRFNGGLFARDAELESLYIPNSIFCVAGQGRNEANLTSDPKTVLYFSAAYDFSSTGHGEGLDLYSLGHIFEQSITELEIRAAELEGRQSIGKVTKRKRDGVYYTPERIVRAIIVETVTPRLVEIREECGWSEGLPPNLEAIDRYQASLWNLRLVDPACGSGAFLVTALRFFADEHARVEELRTTVGGAARPEMLAESIFGVDINPASVEIAKLALWLHSARRDVPLSSLDATVCVGNSLIGPDFYAVDHLQVYAAEDRERVNAFDWAAAFSTVFAAGGFDFVVGNPPYVKLQNFRKVHADMAQYLRDGRGGRAIYASTQSGNFDLFLPFIEKGISLLNERGRMGFIAPSLWLVNEYGEALRRMVLQGGQLARWIDFKSYQIFEEATTYTALQFFTRQPNDEVRFVDAPTGNLSDLDWADDRRAVPYTDLQDTENWSLLSLEERTFISRMARAHPRLDDRRITRAIFQGLITSADSVFHLKRLGPDTYLHEPGVEERKAGHAAYEVRIEDAIMRPLVSGAEAKRYLDAITETYILFPYRTDEPGRLFDSRRIEGDYPYAWSYLLRYEQELRARENAAFDDDEWYRFGRHQNLDKQHLPKLLCPRLVQRLGTTWDSGGACCLDNVDVGGLLPARDISGNYLSSLLNAPVLDFIFRLKSKPFRGNYRSANKQFIAHLPIPLCEAAEPDAIAQRGERLQYAHSERRRCLVNADRRLDTIPRMRKPADWLFPSSSADERKARIVNLERLLRSGSNLRAEFTAGELRLSLDGRVIVDRVFVSEQEASLTAAWWHRVVRSTPISEDTKLEPIFTRLRDVPRAEGRAAEAQSIALIGEALAIEERIVALEDETNALINTALGLSGDEQAMVYADRGPLLAAV